MDLLRPAGAGSSSVVNQSSVDNRDMRHIAFNMDAPQPVRQAVAPFERSIRHTLASI